MWWANGGAQKNEFGKAHIDPELAEDFKVFGLEDEVADVSVLDEQQATAQEPKFEVWPENVKVVSVFQALQTQWHEVLVNGKVIKRGLRYEAIQPTMQLMNGINRKHWREIFDGLRHMEDAALVAFSEQRKRESPITVKREQ